MFLIHSLTVSLQWNYKKSTFQIQFNMSKHLTFISYRVFAKVSAQLLAKILNNTFQHTNIYIMEDISMAA